MNLWTVFCGDSVCSDEVGRRCTSGIKAIFYPNSCLNNIFVISVDILLFFIFLTFILSSKKYKSSRQRQRFFPLLVLSVLFNGVLGLIYVGLGIWLVIEKLRTVQTIIPLHGWLLVLFQGVTWLSLSLIIGLNMQRITRISAWFCAVVVFLFAGFLCIPSIWEVIVDQVTSVKNIIDILCFPGSILLLLLCALEKHTEIELEIGDSSFYTPLGEEADAKGNISSDDCVTPFANAGFFSRMSFWWLNPLMMKGKAKILEDKDIPQLRQTDRAETCYLMFMEQLSKRKLKGSSGTPSILSTIFFCHWKAILISGLFALIKVLTMVTAPLLLKAFVLVAEGNEAFEYEGYALTAGLFLAKCLESLSERQWFFQTRLIGLQVRSMLSAAIYKKQLRLSSAAKLSHSPGEIINYVTTDAYRIGEFPYWFHQIWTTSLQICLSLLIMYYSVGLATIAALLIITLAVLGNSPMAKLQHKYQTEFMAAQEKRLKAITEALANMKVLKLYTWDTHFKKVIERSRKEESEWLRGMLTAKGFCALLFWSVPILVSAATFWTCYFLGFSLDASQVFTFLATVRILQEPMRLIPDIAGVFIEAKVSSARIVKFLEAPELQKKHPRQNGKGMEQEQSIFIRTTAISWDSNSLKATLRNINFVVKNGERVAICGEVGSGKSTLLATILGEVPNINGIVQVNGRVAYVSQAAWIQSGTLRENILFGSAMDPHRYQEVLEKCSLVKDLEMLPFGDLTEIGERGVNLSGGQKQRVQLARALYQDADVYLLDDPFSAVDAQTATSLFNEYVMEALSGKTVVLVTHQVDFLPAFDSVLLMSDGEILEAASYHQLLISRKEFQNLVNAHNDTTGSDQRTECAYPRKPKTSRGEINKIHSKEQLGVSSGDQLIKQEERETGDTGLKPYKQYLSHSKGFLYLSLSTIAHISLVVGQLIQYYWLAGEIQNSSVSRLILYAVYSAIGFSLVIFVFFRSIFNVFLSVGVSKSVHSTLMNSLFRAPMSFYDSTPLGRILSRVSSDMSIIDLDVASKLTYSIGAAINLYSSLGVLAILTWQVLLVIIPMVYLSVLLQRYYFVSAKELMRINGTTKSLVASHLSESIAGSMTIRAFGEEDRFFLKNMDLIDTNATSLFHNFSANEWFIQRLEILCAIVLSSSVLAITLVSLNTSSSGFIGMALSYGLSLNVSVVLSTQNQCMLGNSIISVERVEQYMHIPSEAPEIIEGNRPAINWPAAGKVEIIDLRVRYQPNAPLVLKGITCTFEGGDKIGIVGRTGSGKTTLISVLFRLVDPTEGKIIIDGVDICTFGLHDLRSRIGIIPQDPTLFGGSVRFNLDPLSEYTDQAIWEVLDKCQLREAVQEKEVGLDSLVVQDGSNWSMGERQLFCLGRALLKKSRILVLDEATASIDNTTDSILQKIIRTEFADCTVITVAHRIPTVMDCTMVLAISDGKLVEFDEPMKLMNNKESLFMQLVKEYWSHHTANATSFRSEDW